MSRSLRFVILSSLLLHGLTASAAPPGLNHFYIDLDHATYTAAEQNAFLREQFAAFEERTTVRADKTYTGLYFYGRETYMEFLDATAEKSRPGSSGIAFGVDEIGAMPPAEDGSRTLITREWKGAKWPWFFAQWRTGPDASIVTWLMEYHPDFLAKWHPEAAPRRQDEVTRAAVLVRYKAVLPKVAAQPLMSDIAGLTLAANSATRAKFEAWMKRIGTDFPVRFVDAGATGEGVRAVEFRLGRTPGREETLHFGPHSALTLRQDKTAVWRFD